MATMLDYMRENTDLPLSKARFSMVDNTILSQLAYCDFSKAFTHNVCPTFTEAIFHMPLEDFFQNELLFSAAALGARFALTRLFCYVEEFEPDKEKQFAAVTYLLEDGTAYVAFRGTDDTLVGWKEDFNMTFASEVPSQLRSVKYLEDVAQKIDRPLRLGGHSKGGNLAVYSASYCSRDVQDRIIEIYSNDGPGQAKATVATEGYQRIRSRMRVFLPESSIVGMMLEQTDDYMLVKSHGAILAQHNPYTWQVVGDSFEPAEKHAWRAQFLDATIRTWLEDVGPEKRQIFIDTIYQVLGMNGAQRVRELFGWHKAGDLRRALQQVDAQTAEILSEVKDRLILAAARVGRAQWRERRGLTLPHLPLSVHRPQEEEHPESTAPPSKPA